MQVVLVMFRADGERRSFSITRDVTVIGRREDCDLRIPLGEVSRKHCRLIKDGEGVRLEDLGSSNGTYHNAQRVQEAAITPGDTIQVGPVAFVVQIDGVPGDDELQPQVFVAAAGAAAPDQTESAMGVADAADSVAPAGDSAEQFELLEEQTQEEEVAAELVEEAEEAPKNASGDVK